jgi:hypothetical protein
MRMTVHSFDFIGVVKGFNGTQHQKLNAVIVGAGLCGEGIYPRWAAKRPQKLYDCFAAERG